MLISLYKETTTWRCFNIRRLRFSRQSRLSVCLYIYILISTLFTKMKVPLIMVALLAAVEAYPGHKHRWPFYYSGRFEKGSFDRCKRSTYSQQQNQNNILASDVEWVCQNPKTKDMMIIATDNTQRQYPTTGPPHRWQWHNPPGHQPNHHQHGNQWTSPIIIVQEPTSTNNHQLPPLFPQTTETPNNNENDNNDNNNNNNQPRSTPPPYNGGEGLIDIRVAT